MYPVKPDYIFIGYRFADTEVRSMAVRWIENCSDDELTDYLPQLVQVLACTQTMAHF